LLQHGLGGWRSGATIDRGDLVFPQDDRIVIVLGVNSLFGRLLPDGALGPACLFFLLLLLVDQAVHKAVLGRTVNWAIYRKVVRFTLASRWSLSLCIYKDFGFSSLALLVLVLLLVL